MAGDTEFFSLYEEELGGTRPDRLAGVRPQVRGLQRTVEQIVDPVLVVPLLHDVEPQMVEQLVDVLSPFDFQVPEQGVPSRRSCREPQLAEVPTILYFPMQTVDNPVPGARVRRRGDLRRFTLDRVQQRLLEQSRTSTFQFRVVVGAVFKVFSQNRIQQRFPSSRSLTFPSC